MPKYCKIHLIYLGMDGGLQLLLNIEVFEHMRGSNLDSGVKVRHIYILFSTPLLCAKTISSSYM